MDKALKNIAIYILVVLLIVFALQLSADKGQQVRQLTEPQFISNVEQGQVSTAEIEVDELVYNISGVLKDETKFAATVSFEKHSK